MMNITIILPAVQVLRREPDSPQPTTPFPPVSITPSPTPYNPRTPFSPTEYKHLLEQYQQDESGQITKSQSDLAARQAAYDYENEVFEIPEPEPLPITRKTSLPRPLVRQKSIHPTTSIDNEDLIEDSRTHTTTESPSSADTVRTAIHLDSESESRNTTTTTCLETQTSEIVNKEHEESSASINERKESLTIFNEALQETENETEKLKHSTSNNEITADELQDHKEIEEQILEIKESAVSKSLDELIEHKDTESQSTIHLNLGEIKTLKTEQAEDSISITDTINKIEGDSIPLTEIICKSEETVVEESTSSTEIVENISEIKDEVTLLEENIISSDVIQTEKIQETTIEHLEIAEKSPETELPELPISEVSETTGLKETIDPPENNAIINSENTQEPKPLSPDDTKEIHNSPEEVTDCNSVTLANTQEEVNKIQRSNSHESNPDEKNTQIANAVEQNQAPILEDASASAQQKQDSNNDHISAFKVPEISQSRSPIDSLGVGMNKIDGREKRKRAKEFRDPRKPAAYPQRTTKTTIARQALAREKRRVYVEERIQSYMRSSQQQAASQQQSHRSYFSQAHTQDEDEGHRETRDFEKDEEKVEKASEHLRHSGLTNQTRTKISPIQSLPDINAYNYSFNPNMYTPYVDRSPKTLSAISVIKPPPYSYSSPFAMAEANAHRSQSDMNSQDTCGAGGSGSQSSGIYVDSNTEATSNYWKNVSEQGFFYSFRVRQSGTVQMIDKGIQTGEQPQSYILDFSRKSDGTYYQKSSKPLPQTSTPHLPPINRDKILRDISETVQLRHDAELRRAELIQRANDLQAMVKEKREKINRRHEFWHKKYIEESSMTRPMEAACNSLRSELNTVHRRLIAHLEGRDLPLRLRDGPSKKANYKIMAARLQHEIKELQQKAKSAKLRLESEIKLKEQAEREVRDIRNDLAHKKVVMSLARSQIGGTLPPAHPRAYDSLVY